jgi:hypothetical protein
VASLSGSLFDEEVVEYVRKTLLVVVVAAAFAAAFGAWGAGSALAYGSQDGPLAQVEISFNCTSPTPGVCALFGTGGLWIWAEVDSANNTNTLDYTLAGCGHTVGGGGPGSAGGSGSPGTGTWQSYASFGIAMGAANTDATNTNGVAFPAAVALDSNNQPTGSYYVLAMQDPVLGDLFVVVPTEPGHYNVSGLQLMGIFGPGVNTQTQVAPAKPS